MRVLLLATNTEIEPYPLYPLGMSVIAAALERDGHIVKQLDCLSCADTARGRAETIKGIIHNFIPDVVGISVRNIDNIDSLTPGSHWALEAVRKMVSLVRAVSSATILLGGPAISIMPVDIVDYCKADCAVSGEGERVVCDLLRMIEQGKTLPKVIHDDTALSGKEILSPTFEPNILKYYASKSGVLGLQTKRGCPKHCLYCSYPSIEGRTVRPRNPEEVVDDILRLQSLTDFQELFFTDSVFNDAGGYWVQLAETMLRKKIRIPWAAFFQPENMEYEQLKICKAAGLKALELGTDACSDTTLKALGKGFEFKSAIDSTNLCNRLNLPCAHFVIIGGPGETMETIREGIDNLNNMKNCLIFPFLGIRVLPGTPLQRYAINEGVLSEHDNCLEPTYYFSPHIKKEGAHSLLKTSFKKNKLCMYPPAVSGEKMRALRGLGYRGILWDTMIRYNKH